MFRRREPLPLYRRLRQLLWPSLGWRRSLHYMMHRLSRLPGTPYRIAAGFASGAAISFTPFMGLHFVLAMLLSLALRGNLIAAAFGTVVGNPWTFPLIWAWAFALGRWMLGGSGAFQEGLTLAYIFDRPFEVLLPMTLGGVPTAIVAWFVAYWPIRSLVSQYQRARRWRIRRKVKRQQAALKKTSPGPSELPDPQRRAGVGS